MGHDRLEWRDVYRHYDPPEPTLVFECEVCGGEIYKGNEYTLLNDGTILCNEYDCFIDYAKQALEPESKYAE